MGSKHPQAEKVKTDAFVHKPVNHTTLNRLTGICQTKVAGVTFRLFEGPEDYGPMESVLGRSIAADHVEWSFTTEDFANMDRNSTNQDPHRDRLIAEVDGKLVGFVGVSWTQVSGGPRLYSFQAHVVPDWRGTRLREALLSWAETRARDISIAHPPEVSKFCESWANDEENDWKSLLIDHGYHPARHVYEMVRPDLDNVPRLPLPEGVELAPVGKRDYRRIWKLEEEGMRDHPDYSASHFDEAHYREWQDSEVFDPTLFVVAWAGDTPIGIVQPYIKDDENRRYGRKRGHTEHICVLREWRRKGIASALIARSLEQLKARGMTSATLDVDAENPSGALRVYKMLGFRREKSFTFYRKPL